MLRPDYAQAELAKIIVKDWNEQLCPAVMALPETVRDIGCALLEREADGSLINERPDGKWDSTVRARKWQRQAQLLTLNSGDRQVLFQTLFPLVWQQIEATWNYFPNLPYLVPFHKPTQFEYGQHHINWIASMLSVTRLYPRDVCWLAAWMPYIHEGTYTAPSLFAATIANGGEIGDEVFRILLASARGEHEIGAMGYHVIFGLLASSRPDGWEYLEKMLLAAQRQEGLRDSILSHVNSAHPEAFRRMLRLIRDHDLIRFSSTINSVNRWFRFTYTAENQKDVQVILGRVLDYFENPATREAALNHGDGQSVYLALWTMAVDDAVTVIEPAIRLLSDANDDRRFAAAHLLHQLQLPAANMALLTLLEDPDPQIASFAFEVLRQYREAKYPPDTFERLENLIPRLPKNAGEWKPRLWPWFYAGVTSQHGAASLLVGCLGERSPKRLIPYMKLINGQAAIAALASVQPRDEEIRAVLFASMGHMSHYVNEHAIKAFVGIDFTPVETRQIEKWLTRKTPSFRQKMFKLLLRHGHDDTLVLDSLEHLIKKSQRLQRLAGLELASHMVRAGRSVEAVRALIRQMNDAEVSDEEATLIATILQEEQEVLTLDNALGLIDPADRTPVIAPFSRAGSYVSESTPVILKSLEELIESHKDQPVQVTWRGQTDTVLLAQAANRYQYRNSSQDSNEIPLPELWENWWVNRPESMRDADGYELLRALASLDGGWLSRPDILSDTRFVKQNYRGFLKVIVMWLVVQHPPRDAVDFLLDALETTFATLAPELIAWKPEPGKNNTRREQFSARLGWLSVARQYRHHCYTTWQDEQHIRLWQLVHWYDEPIPGFNRARPTFDELLTPYRLNAATDADIYDYVLGRGSDSTGQSQLSQLTGRKPSALFDTTPGLREIIRCCRDRIVAIELRRGEASTPASYFAKSLQNSGGLEVVIEALRVFGKVNLERPDGTDKLSVLSHLIRVAYPTEIDTPAAFAKAVKAAKLPRERLIELALFAPQWAAHVEHTLKWTGLTEGVWWLYAHTKPRTWRYSTRETETSQEVKERTPLALQNLIDGAVDVEWFGRVIGQLGTKRWQEIASAAKYVSEGIAYKRAQLFADAMLNHLDYDELKSRITVKRNQDAVRALGLIPLSKGAAHERDLVGRYGLIQEFLRTSRKQGAQRRINEELAAQIGLENLARTAGYADPMRLQWAMEARETADLNDGQTLEVQTEGVVVALAINAYGEPELTATKGKKSLKAIPPKVRKLPDVKHLLERQKAIVQQASRMRRSLETAMCRGDVFTAAEIANFMAHPVLAPLLGHLIFVGDGVIGYPAEGGTTLEDFNHDQTALSPDMTMRIAHPHDLLATGDWHHWQHDCFVREIIQPFKQVFRELYVLTPAEEADATISRRYDGHQVQPRQATALLGQRGWLSGFDYERDIHKVFHHDNLTATLDFRWNYGTPGQVEAPQIAGLYFTHRDTGKPVPLTEVSPRLFSEVMRDLDLVVSVAHVGGVDPEASASTVEMRASVIEETCHLLKVTNVRTEGVHVIIKGQLADYSIHLGSAVVHRLPGGSVCIVPVASEHRGRLFLPFLDDDPRTAEVVSKVLLLARDNTIQDPVILNQLLMHA